MYYKGLVVDEINGVANDVVWVLTKGVWKAIKKFKDEKKDISEYKNMAMLRDDAGNQILILMFDCNANKRKFEEMDAMQDVLYSVIRYSCIKFKLDLDFKNVKSLDETIPDIVRNYLVNNIDIDKFIITYPPRIWYKFIFYSYFK